MTSLLEWVKGQKDEAATIHDLAIKNGAEGPVKFWKGRIDAFADVQREIESRGPLLDVGEVWEQIDRLAEEAERNASTITSDLPATAQRDEEMRRAGLAEALEVIDTFTQPEGGGDGLGAESPPSRKELLFSPPRDPAGTPRPSADSVTTSKGGDDESQASDSDSRPSVARPEGDVGLKFAIDLFTAHSAGICPVCESYGGDEGDEGPCPGCRDGQDFPEERVGELDDDEPAGSWLAFELLHPCLAKKLREGGGDAVEPGGGSPQKGRRHVARPGLEEGSGPETSQVDPVPLVDWLDVEAGDEAIFEALPLIHPDATGDEGAHLQQVEVAQILTQPALPVEEGGE